MSHLLYNNNDYPPASKAKELTPGRLLNDEALPLIEQKGANYYEHKQRTE